MPPLFALIIRQNEAIRDKKISGRVLPLETLGSTNGCIDPLIEGYQYTQMATNNTYGFKAYNDSILAYTLNELNRVDGCKDLIGQCRELAQVSDPEYFGNNQTVNEICREAFLECFGNVQGPYLDSGVRYHTHTHPLNSRVSYGEANNTQRSAFDMSHPEADPYPNYRPSGYYNQAWVQAALGVPVNMTEENYAVQTVYDLIGDAIRGNISNLEFILDKGYQVAMIHGDRDYRCNWLGGEAISLAAQWRHTGDFNEAGYESIQTNDTYDGGYVRQVGKFSFSRVFQAGHAGSFPPL
jgi:carboxypeptidase C (cathepsin A)